MNTRSPIACRRDSPWHAWGLCGSLSSPAVCGCPVSGLVEFGLYLLLTAMRLQQRAPVRGKLHFCSMSEDGIVCQAAPFPLEAKLGHQKFKYGGVGGGISQNSVLEVVRQDFLHIRSHYVFHPVGFLHFGGVKIVGPFACAVVCRLTLTCCVCCSLPRGASSN